MSPVTHDYLSQAGSRVDLTLREVSLVPRGAVFLDPARRVS